MKVINNISYTKIYEDFNGWNISVYKPSEFNAPFLIHLHHFDEESNGEWITMINPNSNSAYNDSFVIREAIKLIDSKVKDNNDKGGK